MIAMSNELLNSDLIKKLPQNYGINSTGGVIRMDVFKPFITVETKPCDGLGSDNGWSYYENNTGTLIIQGGCYKGVGWLDNIRYGKRLQNPYNNFVNLFGVWDILSEEGQKFVIDYYESDLRKALDSKREEIETLEYKIGLCNNVIRQVNDVLSLGQQLNLDYRRL